MSEFTQQLRDHLPDGLADRVEDPGYGAEPAAKGHVVPILQELGLEHANYEERIESGDCPDFVWSDADGIDRVVGELRKPWDADRSSSDARYKLEQGIEAAEIYNEQLKLNYILVSDGRYIHLSNEYADPPESIELDLLELYRTPDGSTVEDTVSRLRSWLTGLYEGEWKGRPSERDISDGEVFGDFIEASRAALNEDILPSIERRFEAYEERWNEFQEAREELLGKRDALQDQYRGHIECDVYAAAVDNVAEDLQYDYEEHVRGASSSAIDEDRCIEEIAAFRDERIALDNELSDLEAEYTYAIGWYRKWNRWLDNTGKDYEGATRSEKEAIRETFQLQTLNVLYNRLLLVRTVEDMGVVGQVISDGFLRFFDEKVAMRENQYVEPLTTATPQAEAVYSPLFRRDTPYDWYHWEEPVIRRVLRRFDSFSFGNIDRDIFGAMYQRCLPPEKRKQLGVYYTPPRAIGFLLDYAGFTAEERTLTRPDEPVIDPACGSGTFVLEAMDRVMSALDDSGYDLTRDDDLLDALGIINRKLRGFDIDPFAVQLAQSNLLIRVLQERRDGEDGTQFEVPSFSVYETDSLLTATELDGNEDRFYRGREDDAEPVDAIVDAEEAEYSWVVGNPPYVRSHNQDDRVTAEYERLHDTFGENQSDVFVGFIEQAIEWLADGGRLAFVISNRLLVTEGSEDAMQFILDNATIDLVGDLTRCRVFGFDVNVFPILVVLTKRSGEEHEDEREANETDVVKLYPKGSTETDEWVHALDHAAADLIPWRDRPAYDFATDFESEAYPDITTGDTYDHYRVPQRRFLGDWSEWSDRLVLNYQVDETLWEAVGQMEDPDDCIPLRDVCKIDEDGTPYGVPGRGIEPNKYREYTVEDTGGTPVVSGASIEPFYLGDTQADVGEYIDLDAVQDDDDSDVSDSKLDAFVNTPKLAYCQTSPRLSFAVDDPGDTTRFYNLTGYFLLMREVNHIPATYTDGGDAVDLYYIAGLLNSDVLDFYYKAYYEHLAFRHAPAMRNLPSYLHHLPVHVPSDDERESITQRSRRLHEATREHERVAHELETLFEAYRERGDTVQFRTRVARVVERRPNYNLNTFTISRDGTEIELNRYHTVEMYTEDEAEKLASFLEEFGDRYIGGHELRALELPADLDAFRREHDDLRTRAEALSAEIAEDTAALNDDVYELYGIAAYRDEIEEYLKSFRTVIQ